MSLIIATGSNIGDRKNNLSLAIDHLNKYFELIKASRIYSSPAIEYLNQPDFYNQVLEFKLPTLEFDGCYKIISGVEQKLGRKREISKGPRTIDIDIIFWGIDKVKTKHLTIPHPSWQDRSFVTLPLAELPYFETLKKTFIIPKSFNNTAHPLA